MIMTAQNLELSLGGRNLSSSGMYVGGLYVFAYVFHDQLKS